MATDKIRILLADDHTLIRRGVRALLASEPDMDVVAEAATGRSAVEMARRHDPDVVIMDIAMPDLNGIVAASQIVQELEGVRVLALSMHPGAKVVSEMLRAGASGYLVKSCALEELVVAVRTVRSGRTYLSPEIAGAVVDGFVKKASDGLSGGNALSDREREVLQLVAEGKSSKEIASIIHVSVKTVEAHRQHIMDKLGIRTVAELTKYAIREGLTSLES